MFLSIFVFIHALLAFAQNSVTDYAPFTNLECPDISNTEFVRQWTPQNQTLNPQEIDYITTRDKTVIQAAWKDWLGDGSHIGYNLSVLQGNFPLVGLAFPGGGLRSALYCAATLNGLDARNSSAKAAGTGGLLQVASYMAGLSGGSWVLGSLVFNDMPAIPDMVQGNGADLAGWLLDLPFDAPDGSNLFSQNNQYFFGSVLWSVAAKGDAGVDTSLTDPWARIISYHFLNQTNRANFFTNSSAHGAGQRWSDIPNIPSYQQHLMPLPIAVADSRPGGDNSTDFLPLDPTVYEITPFELASYDPDLSAGANLTFSGTHLTLGKPENGTACINGFDQAGFVMGSSASLFNQILDFANNKLKDAEGGIGSGLLYLLSRQLTDIRVRRDDVANWPSPFNGIKNLTFYDSNQTWLQLIDGASSGENIPYGPLFVNARGIDLIVTIESSADDAINNWPNGSSILFTQKRLNTLLQATHRQFPPTPQTPEDFIATGVNLRPTFFGCDPTKTPPEYPLVIYLPNAPPMDGDDPVTNSATFRLTYTQKHVQLFLNQVFNNTVSGFTPNSTVPDPNYGACLQCAAVDRARLRASLTRSDFCSKCFKQYCFDPANPPTKDMIPGRKLTFVDPDPQGLTQLTGFFSENKFKLIGGLIGLVVLMAVIIAGLIWYKKRQSKRAYDYRTVVGFHEDEIPLNKFADNRYEMPPYRG